MRVLRLVLALAICACALPAAATAATVTIDAVERPDKVTRADVVDEIPRYRLFFNTKAQLKGVVTRDDGTPAAGVAVTIFRQFADQASPGGYKTVRVGAVTTDAQGAYTRLVKPDRITYYYGQVEPQPELGVAAPTRSSLVGLLVAARMVQTSDPRQKGAAFTVTGRVLMPGSRSLGRVVIDRLKGQKATRVATSRSNADGTFSLRLRHTKNGTYRYRLSYVPESAARLISSSLVFSITVTAIEPEDPAQGAPPQPATRAVQRSGQAPGSSIQPE